ncbi:hypothetical protein [Streptomyces sp. XH2]|uniref:hypothetical protein n=1 Tax=Streptomyces sp. XH2 TaxID=3412483 RepID=UPI003C7CDF39
MDSSLIAAIVAGFAAALFGVLTTSRNARMRLRDVQIEFLRERTTSRVGAVICDYVDSVGLQTLAAQYGVGRSPDSIETASERKKSLGAKLGFKGSPEISTQREASESQKLLYNIPADLNVLTQQVIDAIANRESVRTDLAATPPIGLPEIKSLMAAGKGKSLASAESLLDELLSVSKREQFKKVASGAEFLLIDATWRVALEDGAALLNLAQLAASDDVVPMPSSVALVVRVPIKQPSVGELVTPQGLQRLRAGVEIRASVFGRAASIDEDGSTLSVGAITIFSRAGLAAASPTRSVL